MKVIKKEAMIKIAKNLTTHYTQSLGTILLHTIIELDPRKWLTHWAKGKNIYILEDVADSYRMELLREGVTTAAAVNESANLLSDLADGRLTAESAKTLMTTRANMQLNQHLLPARDLTKTAFLECATLG